MNGSKQRYLLDTNAVIQLLRGDGVLLDIATRANWLGVSVITQIEFLAFPDLSPEDSMLFAAFLGRVEVVNIDSLNTRLIAIAIQLRQQHRLKLPDALIVASALVEQACLVTGDRQLLTLKSNVDQLMVMAIT